MEALNISRKPKVRFIKTSQILTGILVCPGSDAMLCAAENYGRTLGETRLKMGSFEQLKTSPYGSLLQKQVRELCLSAKHRLF